MLSGIAALCHYPRTLVSAARPKEPSFLQRRTKFSERRSERPDVTEASSSRPPALRTGGKGVWSHTTDSTYAFRFKDFTFNAQTSLRAGRSLPAKQLWIRQETPIRGPQPSRSMTQTASYLQLYVLRLLARDSSSNRLRGLACNIRARQTQPGQRLHHEESTAERQRALDDPDRSSRSASSV